MNNIRKQLAVITLLLISGSMNVAFGKSTAAFNPSCQIPNKEDSYKLAVSWQPAFCETHRNKPECKTNDKNAYQATHFTLHGLWPNKKECGTNYGLCGKYKKPASGFCNYPNLGIKTDTQQQLRQVMPSFSEGSCLERHEWYKHGTCQTDWDVDTYFVTASQLTKAFNRPEISGFMAQHVGKSVTASAFFQIVDQAFGKNASKRLHLGCDRQGRLTDVFINLPKNISATANLGTLIQQAAEDFDNDCGDSFMIDAIGYPSN